MTSNLTIIPPEDNPHDLTTEEFVFVQHFLTTFNGLEAARKANLPNPLTKATQYLSSPLVLAAIRDALATQLMPINEVLLRISQIARADLADFAGAESLYNLKELREEGIHTHVVKKLKRVDRTYRDGSVETTVEVEIHDPLKALDKLGKYYHLFDKITSRLDIDLDKLTPKQLRRLAEGEDILDILLLPTSEESNE